MTRKRYLSARSVSLLLAPVLIVAVSFATSRAFGAPACIIGTEGVFLHDRTSVQANVASGGLLQLGQSAQLAGNASSIDVMMANYSGISVLAYSGTLTRQAFANTGSVILDHSTTALPDMVTGTINAPSRFDEIRNDAVVTLSPQTLGDVTIRSRAHVTFLPGAYTFRSLNVEPDATLTFTTTLGGVLIDVQHDVNLQSRVTYQYTTNAPLVSIYSTGSSVTISSNFRGFLQAPQAQVVVYSNVSAIACLGGRTVEVHQDSHVTSPLHLLDLVTTIPSFPNPTSSRPSYSTVAEARAAMARALSNAAARYFFAFEFGSVCYQLDDGRFSFTDPSTQYDKTNWDPTSAYYDVGASNFKAVGEGHTHPYDAPPGMSDDDQDNIPIGVGWEVLVENMGGTVLIYNNESGETVCVGDEEMCKIEMGKAGGDGSGGAGSWLDWIWGGSLF